MRPIIFPYDINSQGAKLLAQALDTIRVRQRGTYRPRNGHCIINWGNSGSPPWMVTGTHVLNSFNSVHRASDKLETFRVFQNAGVPHPDWTQARRVAESYFQGEGKVVCRQLLRASEGRGIVVATHVGEMVQAPLYVKYFPKRDEYRCHIFNGEVIDEVQKKLRNGARQEAGHNEYIRSHHNGWVFAREGVRVPDEGRRVAIQACQALGLTFGAVDLAVNSRGVWKVFEVNTAPGIEGTTVQRYAEAIRRYCNV